MLDGFQQRMQTAQPELVQRVPRAILERIYKDFWQPESDGGEPLKNECQAFADSILKNKPTPSDGTFGRKVVEAFEATEFAVCRA